MNPAVARSRLRVAGALQGLLAVLALFFLRFPVLAVVRSLEVADDPTIVTRQSEIAPSFVANFLLTTGIVYGLITLVLAGTAGAVCLLCIQRRRYGLCWRICMLQCMCIPIGTAAGALMLALLSSAAVEEAFDERTLAPSEA